jgi:hypothetical protein
MVRILCGESASLGKSLDLSELQEGYSAGLVKVRSSGEWESSIGITRSAVLLADWHIGSS